MTDRRTLFTIVYCTVVAALGIYAVWTSEDTQQEQRTVTERVTVLEMSPCTKSPDSPLCQKQQKRIAGRLARNPKIACRIYATATRTKLRDCPALAFRRRAARREETKGKDKPRPSPKAPPKPTVSEPPAPSPFQPPPVSTEPPAPTPAPSPPAPPVASPPAPPHTPPGHGGTPPGQPGGTHPHGGPPGQTGVHPHGGPPGQMKPRPKESA